ncbi:uncharacterized protein PG998_013847 [Apiospora kogelbergensis]|uniref:uncharacterized protein n=1 Tax=Apiospora kogelbergensis TaxID=1337665 RepID=UPI00312D351C
MADTSSASLTPGLEWHRHTPCNTETFKSDAEAEQATQAIKRNLQALSRLDALISVSLGGRPPIFVDARAGQSLAKIIDHCNDTPDAELTIKPHYIFQFAEGTLEPRLAIFKDAFFHEAYKPKGSIAVAIKFCDLLGPNPPRPLQKYTPEAFPRLPMPTTDLDQVKRDIKEFGYGFVKDALTPAEVGILKKAVEEQAAGETAAGVAKNDGGPLQPNQRVWVLTNKGDEFLDLLNHPLIDEMLHTDQLAIQPPIRTVTFGMNIMWLLNDFTEKNGGTRIYPGSHNGNVAPEDVFDIDGSIAAQAPAGTAMVFESRLWHATGLNTNESGERPAIIMFFMRSYIRLQEQNPLSLRHEVAPKLTDRHKRFMGYCSTGAAGGLDGEVREGIIAERKDDCVGRVRVSPA